MLTDVDSSVGAEHMNALAVIAGYLPGDLRKLCPGGQVATTITSGILREIATTALAVLSDNDIDQVPRDARSLRRERVEAPRVPEIAFRWADPAAQEPGPAGGAP